MSKISPHRRAYGQFFTPDPVVACCYALLGAALPERPRIVDPACGDGAFLHYAAAHALTPPDRIAGCDLDPALAGALASAGLPGVCLADGLDPANLPSTTFDLVVGNPPFGVATSDRGGAALASEARFVLRALDLARPGGHIALVLPSGVLANERLRGIRAPIRSRRGGAGERGALRAARAGPGAAGRPYRAGAAERRAGERAAARHPRHDPIAAGRRWRARRASCCARWTWRGRAAISRWCCRAACWRTSGCAASAPRSSSAALCWPWSRCRATPSATQEQAPRAASCCCATRPHRPATGSSSRWPSGSTTCPPSWTRIEQDALYSPQRTQRAQS